MPLSDSSLSTGEIIGIVIGGVLGLAAIVGIIISLVSLCVKRNNSPQVAAHPHPHYAPTGPYGQPMYAGYYQPPVYQYPQPAAWTPGVVPSAQVVPLASTDPRLTQFPKY